MSDTRGGPWARRLGSVGAATVLIGGLTLAVTTQPASAYPASTTITQSSWAYVDSRAPDTRHLNDPGDIPVGKIHTDEGNRINRSYFTFDISGLRGAQVYNVRMFDAETQARDCEHRSVELWTTAPITADTTWRNQPAWQQKIYTAGYQLIHTCPADYVTWDATAAVQQAVAAGQDTITLGLRATVEDDADLGRRFQHDLNLMISYDKPPDVPALTGVGADSYLPGKKPCGTSTPGPWVNNLRPTLFATVSDPDNQPVDLTSAVWPVDDPSQRTTFRGGSASSGDIARGLVPAGVLTDGGSYAWSAQATDTEGLTSDWSEPCYFSVDVTRPDQTPVITSTDYPADGAEHPGQGIPGNFTFTANGVGDVAGFSYQWSSGPSGYVAADHLGGSATVALAPPRSYTNSLSVASIDRAGNPSDYTTYRFDTRSTTPLVTVVTTQPKAGGTGRLEVQPGFSLPGYEVTGYTYTVNQGESVSVAARSDGTATIDVPLNYGSNQIEVRSVSANGWVSPVSTAYFYAENSPTVSSADFPENTDGGAVGRTGTFTLTSNLTDSTTFSYSFDYGFTWVSLPVGPDGQASFDWTPDTAGGQFLMAYSQTADGTQSDWSFYSFNVVG